MKAIKCLHWVADLVKKLFKKLRRALIETATELVSEVVAIVVEELRKLDLYLIELFLCRRAVIKHRLCRFIIDHHDGKDRSQCSFDLQEAFEEGGCCFLTATLITRIHLQVMPVGGMEA